MSLWDAYTTGKTLLDPCAGLGEKSLAAGLFLGGIVAPGNYGWADDAAKSAIGWTGKIGEAALKNLGGESQVFFKTSQGGRYVDQLVRGVANESKVGYSTLTKSVQSQIAKDVELMAKNRIQGSTWHFFESPVTGRIGPSAPLQQALQDAGIQVIIH